MPSGYPKNGINKGWFTSERSKGNKVRLGMSPSNKGVPVPKERKKKISDSVKKYFQEHPEVVATLSEKRRATALANGNGMWMLGNKQSPDTIEKRASKCRGELNWRWIKDRSKLKIHNDASKDRGSPAHRYWSQSVKKRDLCICKINNKDCKGRLVAHHILSYKDYPELRFDINNGITLCHFHHPKKREEEKRLIPTFRELMSVSKVSF